MILSGCEDRTIGEAKAAVAATMRDPGSVQFAGVQWCPKGNVVTGQVNAKNGFGAYVGFAPFYYRKPFTAVGPDAFMFDELQSDCVGADVAKAAKAIN